MARCCIYLPQETDRLFIASDEEVCSFSPSSSDLEELEEVQIMADEVIDLTEKQSPRCKRKLDFETEELASDSDKEVEYEVPTKKQKTFAEAWLAFDAALSDSQKFLFNDLMSVCERENTFPRFRHLFRDRYSRK